MKIKKNKIALFIVLMILFFSINQIYANNYLEYEEQLESIREEERANMKKLTGVEKELAAYNYDIVSLDIKMNENVKKSNELQNKIEKANKSLKENEEALNDSTKLYSKAQEEYAEKVRIIYEDGIPSIFDILLSSKGFSDFIRKMNVYTTILEYYNNKSGNIKSKKEYIDYIKKDTEEKKIQVEQYKKDVDRKLKELDESIVIKKKKIDELEKSQENLQEKMDSFTEKKINAKRSIENEIKKIVEEEIKKNNLNNSTSTFTGGKFIWPVDGYNTITTKFGTIYNLVDPRGSAHTGCDIAGYQILGKPIKAIESGTVTTAKYGNYGYGNYVIINHGKCTDDNNNYLSLYGHATTLAVEVGQKVNKGDVIAYVGSTGNSTGPHLHLEIRINGKITDPLIQYPGMEFKFPYG